MNDINDVNCDKISGGSRISQTGERTNPKGRGDVNLLFGQISSENCMKTKKIGPGDV